MNEDYTQPDYRRKVETVTTSTSLPQPPPTDENEGKPMYTIEWIPCAGDGGQVKRIDCKMVFMRKGMSFRGPAVPLCSYCRKTLRSNWKYAS